MNKPVSSSKEWIKAISFYEPSNNITSSVGINPDMVEGFIVDINSPVTINEQEYEIQAFTFNSVTEVIGMIGEVVEGGNKIYPHAVIKTTQVDYSSLTPEELAKISWAFGVPTLSEEDQKITDPMKRHEIFTEIVKQQRKAQIECQDKMETLPLKDVIVFTAIII